MAAMIYIGVGAIIEDDGGRVLLVKHVKERGGFWQGKWICPGGELEYGETIPEGIKREVKEETQLDIELTEALPAFDTVVKSNGMVDLHVIYIDYLARVTGGTLKVGTDIGESLWLEKERIKTVWHELHDDTKRLMEIGRIVPSGTRRS